MGTEGRRTVSRSRTSREPVCPACGQAVGTAIKKRKILGAWVPVWTPQPCHNPRCERFGRTPGGLGKRRPEPDREADHEPDREPDRESAHEPDREAGHEPDRESAHEPDREPDREPGHEPGDNAKTG
ncbi:hypothetical protein [Streptomyces sp. NPDC047928]|uniref:hypothetical protein n=1 Tax=unclassified Streptomyces TaxID=2593676 RepID=UPI0037207B4E